MVLTLRQTQSTFARLLPRLIDKAFELGFDVTLGETYRTPEQAALNAKLGIGIKNSLHCDRLAIDLMLFRDGVWLQNTDDYAELGEFWESLSSDEHSCCWGGAFKIRDGGHFSIAWDGRK